MIAFRDFKPEIPGIFPKARQVEENFSGALAEANGWIFSGSIEVINVETIGLHDSAFEARSIRVWYHSQSSKPRTSPEV